MKSLKNAKKSKRYPINKHIFILLKALSLLRSQYASSSDAATSAEHCYCDPASSLSESMFVEDCLRYLIENERPAFERRVAFTFHLVGGETSYPVALVLAAQINSAIFRQLKSQLEERGLLNEDSLESIIADARLLAQFKKLHQPKIILHFIYPEGDPIENIIDVSLGYLQKCYSGRLQIKHHQCPQEPSLYAETILTVLQGKLLAENLLPCEDDFQRKHQAILIETILEQIVTQPNNTRDKISAAMIFNMKLLQVYSTIQEKENRQPISTLPFETLCHLQGAYQVLIRDFLAQPLSLEDVLSKFRLPSLMTICNELQDPTKFLKRLNREKAIYHKQITDWEDQLLHRMQELEASNRGSYFTQSKRFLKNCVYHLYHCTLAPISAEIFRAFGELGGALFKCFFPRWVNSVKKIALVRLLPAKQRFLDLLFLAGAVLGLYFTYHRPRKEHAKMAFLQLMVYKLTQPEAFGLLAQVTPTLFQRTEQFFKKRIRLSIYLGMLSLALFESIYERALNPLVCACGGISVGYLFGRLYDRFSGKSELRDGRVDKLLLTMSGYQLGSAVAGYGVSFIQDFVARGGQCVDIEDVLTAQAELNQVPYYSIRCRRYALFASRVTMDWADHNGFKEAQCNIQDRTLHCKAQELSKYIPI